MLEYFRPLWEASDVLERLGLHRGDYLLATAHRQESVDVPERLRVICDGLGKVAQEQDLPLIWSVHPRTRQHLDAEHALDPRIRLHDPFGFGDFVALEAGARLVVTDSGTVQEECSLLNVPTVTCRKTTERPETIDCGSNVLSGVSDPERIAECARIMLQAGTAWVSPYAADRDVAAKVARLLVNNAR